MKTINQIIATDDRSKIVEAILQLCAAYSRCAATEKCPNPAKPWARVGDQIFVYSHHRKDADEIQEFACLNDMETFKL